jgi:hypothetical protein
VKITVKPAAVIYLPDTGNVYPGAPYILHPDGNCLYFHWFPDSGLSRTDIADPSAYPDSSKRYIVLML